MATKILADILDSNRNSFNLVRLLAALSVLVSHSCSMTTGLKSSEPLADLTNFSLGQHAVNGFFVISGLTLARSLARSPDLFQFAKSRFLRIFPALFAYGVIFALLVGPFITTTDLSGYFGNAHTWLYPFTVMVEFAKAAPPPQIFSGSVFSEAVNNPLWTIKYEILAYIGLGILFWLGLLHRTSVLLLGLAIAFGTLVVVGPAPESGAASLNHAARYGFCFVLGVVAHHFRAHLPISPRLLILSLALVLLSYHTPFEGPAYMLFVGHIVLVAGAIDYPLLTSFSRNFDLSYGVYIYGWPMQQSLVALISGIGASGLIFLSLVLVPLFAAASWILIEQPVLRLKHVKTSWLLRSVPAVPSAQA